MAFVRKEVKPNMNDRPESWDYTLMLKTEIVFYKTLWCCGKYLLFHFFWYFTMETIQVI